MDWNAVSAIGTIIAAFVGVAGIWINNWEKRKPLNVQFEIIPTYKVLVCNGSTRTAVITKMRCSVGNHVFYVQYFDEANEVALSSHTVKTIRIDKRAVYDSYFQYQMDSLCAPNEKIAITLFDNYGRKYEIDTGFSIALFKN